MPKLYFGSRGGSYYRKNGRKVYVNSFGTTEEEEEDYTRNLILHTITQQNRPSFHDEAYYVRSLSDDGNYYNVIHIKIKDCFLPDIETKKIGKNEFNALVNSNNSSCKYFNLGVTNYDAFVYKFLAYVLVNMYEPFYKINIEGLLFDAYKNLNNESYTIRHA